MIGAAGMLGGIFVLTPGLFQPWLLFLRDLSVRSVILLSGAWLLTAGMRRTSAASRHLVWRLAFLGLLLLPLVSLLPAFFIPILPRNALSYAAPLAPGRSIVSIEAVPRRAPHLRPALAPSVKLSHAPAPAPPAYPSLFCIVWLLGAVLTGAPLGIGCLLAKRRINRCAPVTDKSLLAAAEEARLCLGTGHISLRSGSAVTVPVTFGLIRPVILLPPGTADWPPDRLRVMLLHEVAHIQRGDWATQTLARLLCAAFWHNPLVWIAVRNLRAEAERACDDLVLSSGVSAPDYAMHLLAVAQAFSRTRPPFPLAVPMVGNTPLETRVRAVLSRCSRRPPSRSRILLAAVFGAAFLFALAVSRPVAHAARSAVSMPALSVRPGSISPQLVLPLLSLHQAAGASQFSAKAVPSVNQSLLVQPSLSVHPLLSVRPLLSVHPLPAAFAPSKSTGDRPVKPITSAQIAAAALLTAGLALPSAAQSVVPQSSVPSSAALNQVSTPTPASLLRPASSLAKLPGDQISVNWQNIPIARALSVLFQAGHRDYVTKPGVSGTITLSLTSPVSFDTALKGLVDANSQPLEWRHQGGVYYIQSRAVSLAPATAGAGTAVQETPVLVTRSTFSLDIKKMPIRQALDTLFAAAGVDYTVASSVPDTGDVVTVHLTNVPLPVALGATLSASSMPLAYTVHGNIYMVTLSPQDLLPKDTAAAQSTTAASTFTSSTKGPSKPTATADTNL